MRKVTTKALLLTSLNNERKEVVTTAMQNASSTAINLELKTIYLVETELVAYTFNGFDVVISYFFPHLSDVHIYGTSQNINV